MEQVQVLETLGPRRAQLSARCWEEVAPKRFSKERKVVRHTWEGHREPGWKKGKPKLTLRLCPCLRGSKHACASILVQMSNWLFRIGPWE